MRKRFIVLALVLVAAATPLAVLAATGHFSSRLDLQRFKFRTTSVSTSSTAWHNVPGLDDIHICSDHEVSATLSVNLRGAAARFRVRIDQAASMKPGSARFVPNGEESFSYTFAGPTGPFEANDNHVVDVQWRSPTGQPVTLVLGGVNLLYEQGTLQCP
jgi:hypothetical protein